MMRFFFMLFCGLSVAGSLSAEPYQIDQIRVDPASTIPAEIILDDSLLEEGVTYTGRELDQALFRIRRLPFVYSATYRLERTESGGWAVVFEVSGEKPFFYDVSGTGSITDGEWDGAETGGVGGRFFIPGGVLEGTVSNFTSSGDDSSGNLNLTWSGYGLFGSGASASVSLDQTLGDGGDSDPIATVELEVPINLFHSVRATSTRFRSSRNARPEPGTTFELENEVWSSEIAWLFDTRNDPQFMRAGRLLSAGVQFSTTDSQGLIFTNPEFPDYEVTDISREQLGLVARAEQYWPLGDRGSLFGRLSGSDLESDSDGLFGPVSFERRAGDLSLGYGVNLGTALNAHGPWRARVEFAGGWLYEKSEGQFMTRSEDLPYLSAGGSFRHPWGRVKLDVIYLID